MVCRQVLLLSVPPPAAPPAPVFLTTSAPGGGAARSPPQPTAKKTHQREWGLQKKREILDQSWQSRRLTLYALMKRTKMGKKTDGGIVLELSPKNFTTSSNASWEKKYWHFFFLFTQSGLVNRRMANKWTGQTWAMRASSCSFTSRDSFLLMKSLSVELCWTLNSLQVNSIPRWRSFTSHRTFSRLTDTQTHTGEGGSRSSQLCSNWLSHSPAAALST